MLELHIVTKGAQHVKEVKTQRHICIFLFTQPFQQYSNLQKTMLQCTPRLPFTKDWPCLHLHKPPTSCHYQTITWVSISYDYRFGLERLEFARLAGAGLEGFPNYNNPSAISIDPSQAVLHSFRSSCSVSPFPSQKSSFNSLQKNNKQVSQGDIKAISLHSSSLCSGQPGFSYFT